MTFFQGTLQEGIAAALQQEKSVVCFVTDGEAESQEWENDFFVEEEIRSLLPTHAVCLRLAAGSQEEGFLSQLYPIPKRPTVVIIRNGELKEYIAAGVTRDEFVRRMKTSLTAEQPAPSQPIPPQPAPPRPQTTAAPAPSATQPQTMAAPVPSATQPSHAEESSASSSGQATPPSPTGSRMQSLVAERAASLIQQQTRQEEEDATQQRAEKAKAEALASKKTAEQSKHAAALKKKQQEAREERERILKAIEDDKVARKAQQAEVAAARRLSMVSEKPDPTQLVVPPPAAAPGKPSEHCAIQVRLFDGSTIRHRFSSGETLSDVRRWVNETREDGKTAYTFKVLLTPLPSKTIDVADEDKTLQALELAPSSTLILLRVPKFAAAYSASSARSAAGEAQGNAFQRFVAYVLAVITGFFSTVSAFFSTLFSTAGPPAASEPSTSQTSQSQPAADAARRRAGGRIAGVDHTDGRRNDQHFYNGNSTNFEPRSDDGE